MTLQLTASTPVSSLLATTHHLVVIDPGVADYPTLAAGVLPGVAVQVLTAEADGIAQITAYLQQHPAHTVHIMAHGAPGRLWLGNGELSLDNLDTYADALSTWFEEDGAELLIYGCNVAAGDAGAEFIAKLHHLTGATLAASATPTGNTALGGDWELAVTTGQITVDLAFTPAACTAYPGVLPYTTSTFSTGSSPQDAAIGDFNGDGNADIVTASYGTGQVSILLNDGSGSFGTVTQFTVSPYTSAEASYGPRAVAIADFNGDGKADIVTANNDYFVGGMPGSVSILLGDGAGSFGAATRLSVGSPYPVDVAIGDFNGDGKADIASLNSYYKEVAILLGDGSGGFALQPTRVPVGSNPRSVAIGDFNGDGKADFATANYSGNSVSIALGNGDGSFSTPTAVTVGTQPISVAFGDFDGDGKADFATANLGGNSVSIALGNGDGSFSTPTAVTVGTRPYEVAIGDFNGDGKVDFATADSGSRRVSIVLGNGDGSFSAPTTVTVGSSPYSVATGDFNQDSNADFVAANYLDNSVSVVLYTPNTAPSLITAATPVLTAMNEDAGAPVGAVGTLVSSLVNLNPPIGGLDNVTDADTGAVTGMAITAADTTNGTWFFSTNNGSTWTALGAVSNTSARLLAADANTRVYFQPSANYNGTVTNALTFRAWDQTSGTNGGTANTSTNGGGTAFSSATDTANITVNPVNEAPTALALENTTTSLAENTDTTSRLKVADIAITDDALGTNTIALSGTDAASFEVEGTVLYLKAGTTLDFETQSSYAVTIEVDDTAVGSSPDLSQNFTLTVTDVNEAPTALALENTTTSLAENTDTTSRIQVADIAITDDALGTNTIALSGTDAASFEVEGTVLYLKANTTLDFETQSSYAVTVDVDDTAVGSSPDLSQNFTLTVTDVNEAPTALALENTTTSLAENTDTTSRLKVADIAITDDALGTNTIALSGTDAASFEVDAGVLYLKANTTLDFETQSSYDVTVDVDDTAVGSSPDLSQNFTLTVTDVNEAPTALALENTTTSLAENTDTTSRIQVADIAITDDALGTNTIALSGTDAASFEVEGTVLYLKANTTLDFETQSSYAVTVDVDDTAVGSSPDLSQNFTLTVTDVNEAPTALAWKTPPRRWPRTPTPPSRIRWPTSPSPTMPWAPTPLP
jgi:hypothetical protein